MYGIDRNEDLSFLVGKELLQVCLGSYQTILNFEGDISISMQCASEIVSDAQALKNEGSLVLLSMAGMIGSRIASFKRISQTTLQLNFAGKGSLVLHDDSPQLESFQISSPHHELIV